jgi:pimeloyl-ACP methyl ester carboxylesterase
MHRSFANAMTSGWRRSIESIRVLEGSECSRVTYISYIYSIVIDIVYDARQLHIDIGGTGDPLILIHGNPATHSVWGPIVGALRNVRRTYGVDLPGFGASPRCGASEHGVGAMAELLMRVADANGIDTFDVIGHSFGGAIALTMAARYPERIRSVVGIAPMTDLVPAPARLARIPAVRAAASLYWRMAPSALRAFTARRGNRLSYGASYTTERAGVVARELNRPYALHVITALASETDFVQYGREIETLAANESPPALLIGAARDSVVPIEHFQRLCHRIPRAKVHLFAEGGHVPIWQYPEEVARIVIDFLAQTSAARAATS